MRATDATIAICRNPDTQSRKWHHKSKKLLEECRRHIDKACPPGCPIPRERPLLRTVSLPAPRPAIQDDNDLIYRPAPAAVEQVVELHEEE